MPTMNDVAREAGVSRGTVSNVINGQKVKPELKQKVEEAIAKLGYIPNANARSLKSNKTNTVVVILPTVWNPFFSKLISVIETELRKLHYKIILCLSQNDAEREVEYVEMAKQNQADGIISITYSNIWPNLKDSQIPLVTLERYFSPEIPFISTDNYLGGELAARKLIELGCKRLLFVGRETENNQIARIRKEGFEMYCREKGIQLTVFYPKTGSSQFPGELESFIRKEYENGIPYDGIFASADRYVDHLSSFFMKYRPDLQIGKDVQMIGFDGVTFGPNDPVRISSISQPVEQMGKEAVNSLLAQIHGRDYFRSQLLNPEFIQGWTTALPDRNN